MRRMKRNAKGGESEINIICKYKIIYFLLISYLLYLLFLIFKFVFNVFFICCEIIIK